MQRHEGLKGPLPHRCVAKSAAEIIKQTPNTTKCCRRLLDLWNSIVLPETSFTEPPVFSASDLHNAEVLLHNIGSVADRAFRLGDFTLVPDVVTAWPSIWIWIKQFYSEHLVARTSASPASCAPARAQYGRFINVLSRFTTHESKLLEIVAGTPGYIAMITSLWMQETKDLVHHFGFGASYLVLPLISNAHPHWADEVAESCGGTPTDVCLDHISYIFRQKKLDYTVLGINLKIIYSFMEYNNHHAFLKALAFSPRIVGIFIDAIRHLISSPSHFLLKTCAKIITCPLSLGGFDRISEAMRADFLPDILKLSQLVDHDDTICSVLVRDCITQYLIHRPILTLVSASLDRINARGLKSQTLCENKFKENWLAFEKSAEHWLERNREYKTQPRSSYMCGNSLCGKLEADEDKVFMRCAGCSMSRFCSRQCQKEAWKETHRCLCKDMQQSHHELSPVVSSNTDLKFLGHVVAQDIMKENAMIEGLKMLHSLTTKPLLNPSQVVIKVDYTLHPVDFNIASLIPLTFSQILYPKYDEGESEEEVEKTNHDLIYNYGAWLEKYMSEDHAEGDPDGTPAKLCRALQSSSDNLMAIYVLLPRGEFPQMLAGLLRRPDLTETRHASGDVPEAAHLVLTGLNWIYTK